MSDVVNGGVTDNPAPYGYCPQCGAPGMSRERRPDGDDVCAKGHVYPSALAALAVPQVDPADWMRGQMIMALRDVEKRFAGAAVTLFVSAPGGGMYSHATSATPEDLKKVLSVHLAEIEGTKLWSKAADDF